MQKRHIYEDIKRYAVGEQRRGICHTPWEFHHVMRCMVAVESSPLHHPSCVERGREAEERLPEPQCSVCVQKKMCVCSYGPWKVQKPYGGAGS